MVDVSVGSWHHLVEHDSIQENEAASNQECQIINSELLAASEATSMLGRHLQSIHSGTQLFATTFVVHEQCLQVYCETAVAAGQAHVHRMVFASFEETLPPLPLQPFLDSRRLIHQRALPR